MIVGAFVLPQHKIMYKNYNETFSYDIAIESCFVWLV